MADRSNWAALVPLTGLQNGPLTPTVGDALVWNGDQYAPAPVAGLGGVSRLTAGAGITLDPVGGTGVVEVTSTGIIGPTGPQGPTGSPGPTGPQGPAGTSGFVVAIATSWANMNTQTWLLGASPTVDGQLVQLLGYDVRDDGGGGMFEWYASSTLADDGGCIMQLSGVTTGRLMRVAAGIISTATQLDCPTVNVWWFGAIPGSTAGDCQPGIARAVASIANGVTYTNGCLYFPAGYYRVATALNFTFTQAVMWRGDGSCSILANGIAAQQTAFCKLSFLNGGGVMDMAFQEGGGATHFSGVWLNSCANATFSRILNQLNAVGTVYGTNAGGQLRVTSQTRLTMSDVYCVGNGLALFQEGGSGLYNNCWFYNNGNTGSYINPAMHWSGSDSLQMTNCFFQGGGPWATFASAALTSAGAPFTVAAAGHTFIVGDYILIQGAAHAGYNGWWQITSVVAATSVTVSGGPNLGNDTVTLSSLWSCIYVSGANSATESLASHVTCNTPGYTIPLGSVGVHVDAYAKSGTIGEISFNDFLCDFGACAFYLHGTVSNGGSPVQYNSNVAGITLNNCRPNGGPRDTFGCFRLEGCVTVTVDGCRMHPGNNSPPGTGLTFNSIVVTDGGQTSGRTQDIYITGGVATQRLASAQYSAATIYAFTFIGANVHNVSAVNVGVDVTSTNANVAQLLSTSTGAAALSNGITVLYSNNAGRLTLIDSTRAIPGGNL